MYEYYFFGSKCGFICNLVCSSLCKPEGNELDAKWPFVALAVGAVSEAIKYASDLI